MTRADLVLLLPFVPLGVRAAATVKYWSVAQLPIGDAARVESHRSLLVGLAGFSLAGIAIIGTQGTSTLGRPFAEIVLSFLTFLASLGVQAWKSRWWHDQLADSLRDVGSTSLVVFVVHLACGLRNHLWLEPLTFMVVIGAAVIAWVLDCGVHLVLSVRYLRLANDGRRHGEKTGAA